MKLIKFPILFLLVSITIVSCRKETKPSTVYQEVAPVLAPNTYVLDEAAKQQITFLDSSKLVVNTSSVSLEYKVGDIIASGITEKSPLGFLRRVIGVKKEGNSLVYTTSDVSLTEAVQDGSYKVNRSLTDQDIKSVKINGDQLTQGNKRGVDFSLKGIEINSVLHDLDNDLSTKNDQIKAIGKLTIEPKNLLHELVIKDFELKHLLMQVNIEKNTSIQIVSNLEMSASKKFELGRVYFNPIDVQIGILPVIVTPVMIFYVDFSGKVSTSFSTSFTMKETKVLGVAYDGFQFSKINETKEPVFTFEEPNLETELELKSALGVGFNFLFYGFESAKTFISTDGYFKLKAKEGVNLSGETVLKWQLFGGFECKAGVKLEFFTKKITDKTFTLLVGEKLLGEGEAGTVKDIDGNVYKTVRIGKQVLMKSNLKTTRYNDGTLIPYIPDSSGWVNNFSGAWCYYNNNSSYNAIYGKLYNWYAVSPTTNGNKNICPTGWHVPTYAEWTVLTDAINVSLFTGLPGGYRSYVGYSSIGRNGYWWSSTELSTTNAWYRVLDFSNGNAYRDFDYKGYGLSVRCLRD